MQCFEIFCKKLNLNSIEKDFYMSEELNSLREKISKLEREIDEIRTDYLLVGMNKLVQIQNKLCDIDESLEKS